VVVASEFSRTYRTLGFGDAAVNDGGTDHNQSSNFVLIGGKGIKPGLIAGDTDLKEADQRRQFTNVSKAHRERDRHLIKSMGLPFDFEKLVATPFPADASFRLDQHLTYNSVINTVLHLFGAGGFTAEIEGTNRPAPLIRGLLA